MALAPVIAAFQWGANGERMSPEEVARQRKILDALMGKTDTSPVGHWSQGAARVVDAFGDKLDERRLNAASTQNETDAARIRESLMGTLGGGGMASGGYPAAPMPASGAAPTAARPTMGDVATNRVAAAHSAPLDMNGNEVFSGFMDTVKAGGVNNPFALAAIASTGKRESGFSPGNATRTWSDPSESGQPGTAGGIMSWRGPRYQALTQFGGGDLSPQTQAQFFLQEDPALIASLNNAQSLEEAQGLINRAWAFAGYNRPGGEAAERLATAQSYLPMFQGGAGGAVGANEAMASGQMAGGPQIIDPGIIGGAASAPSDPNIAPEWATNPNMGGGSPQGTGTPGEVRQGADGQTYMYAETTGMQGATGPMGWIPYNPEAGGAEPMAMQPAPPLNAPQTVQDMPVAQPQQQVAQALFPMEEMAGMNPQRLPAQTGVDPRIIEALSSPYVDDGTRRMAEALFGQQMQQQQAEQERMRAEQEAQIQMQQRMQAAQAAGVDPRFIGDDEIWKAGVGQQFQAPTTDIQEYEYARNQGFQGSLPEYQEAKRRAGATNVNVNTGATNDFFSGLSNAEGSSYQQILSTAPTAARTLGQLDQLEGLLANVDTGAIAQWKQIAGNYGVNTEGLSDIQAASALINQMVPSQRPPGSGPMSDADLELFKQSVPRIINQPGGNEKIIQTMRAINRYDMELARIVQDGLATAETTDNPQERAAIRADMRRRIGEMQNPLANFNDRMGSGRGRTEIDGYVIEEVE